MATKTIERTKEELNALRIQAMLQGIDPETISASYEEEVDDIEIEVEDEEKPAKKTKGRKSKAVKPVGSQNQVFTTQPHYVDDSDKFKGVDKSAKMNIVFNEHDIPYKEQLWKIDRRIVEYTIETAKHTKVAKDIAREFGKTTEQDLIEAETGEVRYYRVVTFDNVLNPIRCVGYVRMVNQDGKIKFQIKVLDNVLKEHSANPEKVKENIKKTVYYMIGRK